MAWTVLGVPRAELPPYPSTWTPKGFVIFPVRSFGGTTMLPPHATFWMPRDDEIDEESGIGYFRDTWLIRDVPVLDATEVIDAELRMADAINGLARDEDEFEQLASLAESADVYDLAVPLDDSVRDSLAQVVSDTPELDGLELGVAGLVFALAAVGFIPAASCRSHVERSWSDAPVVLFAATEYRAHALERIVGPTGCTFTTDEGRPELIVVRGRSIKNTMELAAAVMNHQSDFVQSQADLPKWGPTKPEAVQDPLF